ncbi:MAG: hydantoinase B/oxoprolinase family protein, partial [Pseudomonadota bacterium]
TEMVFQTFSPNSKVTARNRDRTRFTGWGIAGGHAGGPSKFILNPNTNREVNLRNTDILTMGPGDVLHVTCGGAGGWGNPLERNPDAVLLDWRRGWITIDHARSAYGVVIADGSVDLAATEAERSARIGEAVDGFYELGPERTAFEKIWTDGNYAVLTDCLASLPVHWRFYAKHRIFAAVEALGAGDLDTEGRAVRRIFESLKAEFPQLQVAAE